MTTGRKTGGRTKGTPNKATAFVRQQAVEGIKAALDAGILPLDVILARMRNETLSNGSRVTDAQFEAAIAAAPYLHAKLSAIAVATDPEGNVAARLTAAIARAQPTLVLQHAALETTS